MWIINSLIVIINHTDPTCNLESNGTAVYEVNNNSGVVTQIWNEVVGLNNYNQISFSSDVDNLSPGNYMIEVTDELGCKKEEFFTINEFWSNALAIGLIVLGYDPLRKFLINLTTIVR